MHELALSIGEPFTSPAWGSNFVMFTSETALPVSEEQSQEYLRRVCRYARHYEVYLIPERFMLMGYTCMCLISPKGKVVGAQKANHLYLPTVPGSRRGLGIEILSTEFGGIFLCVDVDIYHPEVLRIAARMGAQYIFCSQQIRPGDYNTHMVISGVWNAAQSNSVFAVSVSNEFHAVCAPLKLSPREDGFLAKPTLKTPLLMRMLADDLAACPRQKPLSRKLYALHRNELIG